MIPYAEKFREAFGLTDAEWESGCKLPFLHGYTPHGNNLDLFFDTESKNLLRTEHDPDVGPKKLTASQIDPERAAWDTIMSLFKDDVKGWWAGSLRPEMNVWLAECSWTITPPPHPSIRYHKGGSPVQLPPWRMSVPWDVRSLWVYIDPTNGFESRDFTHVALYIAADVEQREKDRLGIFVPPDSVPVCEHPGIKRVGRFEPDDDMNGWTEPNHGRQIRIERRPFAE